MPYSNPITTQEQQDLARYNPLHPRDGSANELYMPPAYFLVPPATQAGPVRWRLFDAAYISTGIIDPNRLGTGATGAGNLYLADDGTWKPVSGGGGVGTLDQVTDLGNVTTNTIDVGGVKSDYFLLDTTATPTLQPGMFGWNDAYGTADLRLKGNNVTLQLGQEILARVVNKTGADLLESDYKVVRVRVASEGGAQGQRLAVVLAQGDNDPDSATTLGVVTETIADNQEGFITILGNVNNINTTGSLQGETWVDGDVLYLSPTTPGGLTKVKPQAPQHTLIVGYVVYAHNNQGKIFVKVDNGYELDELHNVLITSPASGQLLRYNGSVWYNWTPDFLTSVPTLDQVTTAGNTTTNSITVGGLIVDTNTLFVDAANDRVGIGTTSPLTKLYVEGTNVTQIGVKSTTNSGAGGYIAYNDVGSSYEFGMWGSTRGGFGAISPGNSYLYGSVDLAITTTQNLKFGVGSGVNERMRIVGSTGNVLINTTTDAGFKFDVNGTARIQGDLSTSAGKNMLFGTTLPSRHTNSAAYPAIFVGNSNSSIMPETGTGYKGISMMANIVRDITSSWVHQDTTQPGWIMGLNYETANTDMFAIYRSAATAGTANFVRLFTINGAGNVLIGTTTDAGYRLDVNGTVRIQGATFDFINTSAVYKLGYSTVRYTTFEAMSDGATKVTVNGTTKFYIGASSLTGIEIPSAYSIAFVNPGVETFSHLNWNTTTNQFEFKNGDKSVFSNIGVRKITTTGSITASSALAQGAYFNNTLVAAANNDVLVGLDINPTFTNGAFTGVTNAMLRFNMTSTYKSYFASYQTSSPNDNIKLVSNNSGASFGVQNINASGFSGVEYLDQNGNVKVFTGFNNNNAKEFRFNNISTNGFIQFIVPTDASSYVDFGSGYSGGVVTNSLIRVRSNGNMQIGTTTDSGYKLDVNGTLRVSGELFSGNYTGTQTSRIKLKGVTSGASSAFFILGEHGANSNNLFYIREDGSAAFNNLVLGGPAFINSIEPTSSGTTLVLKSFGSSLLTYGVALQNGTDFSHTSGSRSLFRLGQGFAPTSGTGVYNTIILDNVITQTGGANGITRGIYINPTLTTVADYRAIETTAGKVIHQGLTNATQTSQVYYNTTTGELTYGALPTPATPTLAQVTTAGNTTTNSISVGAITSSGAIRSTLDTTGNALELFGAFSYYSGVQIGGVGLDKSPYINLFANGGATTSINFTRQNTPGVTFKIMHSYSQGIAQTPSFLGIGVDGTSIRILGDTGNVLINQGSDAGYKLDVNGSTRVKGTGTTSATTSFLVQNSSNGQLFKINDDGLIYGAGTGQRLLVGANIAIPGDSGYVQSADGVTGVYPYVTPGVFRFVNWINAYEFTWQYSGNTFWIKETTAGTRQASAKLQVDSVIQGFLQPRMTNAQAVAIATPATGLQVYDTTNNKNLLHNGTAWQNIATESWVTAQGYLTSAPIPTLAQVTAAGNTTTANITVSTHITIKANNDSVYSVGNNNFNNISLAGNTFGFGRNILSVATSTSETVALGDSALNESAFSYRNIAIGTGAGRKTQKTAGNLTVGGSNVFVGVDAGAKVDLGYSNTFLGDAAGSTMDVLQTVAVGAFAGGGSGISTLTQGYSVYLGFRAGGSSTAGDNVFIGYDAGLNSTKSNWFILGNRNNAGLIEGNFSTGNVLIGSSTDNGTNKLQVNGSISATGGTSTNWNTAFSWGNHASAGYLTSFTETDPTVPSHVKAITTTNISNWNTAYSWGNHATAGYLTSVSDVWVNTTGDTMTGQLVISTTGTAGNPTLRINTSTASAYVHSQENIAANLASGQRNILVVGQDTSTKNSGYFGYYWAGAGSDSNFITMGHWGNNDLFRIYGNGNVLINTTADAGYKLDVNGSFRATSNSYLATAANTTVGIGVTTALAKLHVQGADALLLLQGSGAAGQYFPSFYIRGAYPKILFQSEDGSVTFGTILTIQDYGGNPWGNIAISSRTGMHFLIQSYSGTTPVFSFDSSGHSYVTNNLSVGAALTVTSNFTVDTNTFFVNASTNRVGIGTTSPSVLLQAGAKVIDDNNYAYTSGAAMFVNQTQTSASVLNDPQEVLILARQGTAGQAFGAAAVFELSRFENLGTSSRTRLDIKLADGFFLPNSTRVMTMLSNGTVGVGVTSPQARLHVADSLLVTSVNYPGITVRGSYPTLTFQTEDATITYGSITTTQAYGTNPWGNLAIQSRTGLYIYISSFSSSVPAMSFLGGNLQVGLNIDYGYKFDVNGTLRSVNSAYFATTSGSVGIGTTSPAATLDVNGNTIIRGNLSMNDASNRYIYGLNGNYINLYNGGTGGVEIYGLNGTAENKVYGGLRVTGNLITQGSFSMNGSLDIGSNNSVYAMSNGITLYRGFDASMQFYLGHPTVGDFLWDYPAGTTLMTLKRGGNLLIGTTTDSGYKLNVNGSFRSNGDSYVASANGRVFGFDGLSAGQTLHFQYGGDSNHRISTTHGSATQMDAYHGLIIRTSPASGGKALIVNQRNSAHFIQEWQENGTQKAYINSQGNLYLAQLDAEADGPVISTSGLLSSVAGYTGTVTIQQPAPLPPINIDVQNGIIVNVF